MQILENKMYFLKLYLRCEIEETTETYQPIAGVANRSQRPTATFLTVLRTRATL